MCVCVCVCVEDQFIALSQTQKSVVTVIFNFCFHQNKCSSFGGYLFIYSCVRKDGNINLDFGAFWQEWFCLDCLVNCFIGMIRNFYKTTRKLTKTNKNKQKTKRMQQIGTEGVQGETCRVGGRWYEKCARNLNLTMPTNGICTTQQKVAVNGINCWRFN